MRKQNIVQGKDEGRNKIQTFRYEWEVNDFFFRYEPPTLNSVEAAVNIDCYLTRFKISTSHVILKATDFIYERIGNRAMLTERDDVCFSVKNASDRLDDLKMKKWNIVSTDESRKSAPVRIFQ
jgi:hypothetical protein